MDSAVSEFNNDLNKRNPEHYVDMTAYEAIKHADYEAEKIRHSKVIGCILRICELSDYEVISRIELRDKRNGRIW